MTLSVIVAVVIVAAGLYVPSPNSPVLSTSTKIDMSWMMSTDLENASMSCPKMLSILALTD
ncbi:hypothetical protein MYX84_08935 [Acidobacteria bacterium AH-259-O06]|nr:hypothetical protein [Acidobacteria bacterium AH-259-O06]